MSRPRLLPVRRSDRRPRLLPVRWPNGRTIGYFPACHETLPEVLILRVPAYDEVASVHSCGALQATRQIMLERRNWRLDGGDVVECWRARGELRDLVRLEYWRAPG